MTAAETCVTLYTRPGCTFSAVLRWQLRRLAIPLREVDIWNDRAAAGVVREITGGDETVPTVVVGTTELVNPSVDEIRAALLEVTAAAGSSRSTPALVARGIIGPVLMLAVWAVAAIATSGAVFHLGPALVAASWAVTARTDAARGLGFRLGGTLAAAGAALAVGALLLLPALGALAPTLPEAMFTVALGAALGVIIGGRGHRSPRPAGP